MRKIKTIVLMLFVVLLLMGCVDYGTLPDGSKHECVGVVQEKNPDLVYDYSVNNILTGIIFSETIVIPLIVVFDGLWCPVDYARD